MASGNAIVTHKAYVLLLSLAAVTTSLSSMLLPREVDQDYDYDFGNMSNSTPTMAPPTPILTEEAIANIVVSGTVVIFVTTILIILFCTFEKGEHKLRVKTSLQRNRQIDIQIAAEKRRRELRTEQFRQKMATEASSNVLQVRTTVTETGEIRYEEETRTDTSIEAASCADPLRESNEETSQVRGTSTTGGSLSQGLSKLSSSEVVIDLEGDSDTERDLSQNDAQLVEVSLNSYSPFPLTSESGTDNSTGASEHKLKHTVLLVQPANDS